MDLRQTAALPPVVNQGSTEWCHAFATADAVSTRLGVVVSAFDIAISARRRALRKGGHVFSARNLKWIQVTEMGNSPTKDAEHASRIGYCEESRVRSRVDESFDLKEEIDRLSAILRHRPNQLSESTIDDYLSLLSPFFPQLSRSEVAAFLARPSSKRTVQSLTDLACGERIHARVRLSYSTRDQIGYIDRTLDQGHAALVDYPTEALQSPEQYLSDGKAEGLEPNHGSSIVARRWNGERKQCEYGLKNSWGRDCSGTSPRYLCDQGVSWIPEQDLLRIAHGIYY